MKKLVALLLVLVMVCTMAACDSGAENNPVQTGESQLDLTGKTVLKSNFWTVAYDPDVWTNEEDEFYDDSDYAEACLFIPDGEDSYITYVTVSVAVDDSEDFRDYLESYGFDAYAYAVNNAYELVNVGGVDCLKQEGNYWGEPCLRYFGRAEAASVTVYIEILGEYESAQVEELLAGITILAEDIGNEDSPWPWEGEPFSASDASAMAGTCTVSSQWIPVTECIVTGETFEHAVAVSGDQAYILVDGVLKQYAYDGSSLVYEADVTVDGEFGSIQSTRDGTVWISDFMEPLVSLRDGVQTGSFEDTQIVTMHPSGSWGISWFSEPACEKITLSGGVMTGTAITFAEVSTISTLVIDEDYIYVCGSAADDSGHKVFVYDANGVLKMTLTDRDGDCLGSITFIAQTPNGFLGLDGNMREIVLWTKDGQHIGTIEDSDLFGTSYPWFCGGTLLADGSILVIMTEDRADGSAMELVAFKLSVK